MSFEILIGNAFTNGCLLDSGTQTMVRHSMTINHGNGGSGDGGGGGGCKN